MMKSHHLKRFIDRLMMVPREEKGELADGPKGHGGHGDLEDLHDDSMDKTGLAHILGRDTMKDDEASIHDERDDMFPEKESAMASVAHHDDEENPEKGSLEDLLGQKNSTNGEHKPSGSKGDIKAPSKPRPQSVTEPHSILKQGSLSSSDHEKHVKMERERHAKIFGGY